jgi:hypothetical protein
LKSVHFFNSSLGVFDVFILNEGESFAFSRFWVAVNINVVDLTKGLKKLFQLTLRHFSQLTLQPSHLNFGKSSFLLSLLFVRVDLLCYFHLPKLKTKITWQLQQPCFFQLENAEFLAQ